MAEARSTGGLAGDPALDGGGVHGREEEAAAAESDHEKKTISIRLKKIESCDFKAATKLEEVNNCGSTDTGASLQQLPAFFILRILIVIHWSWSDWKE